MTEKKPEQQHLIPSTEEIEAAKVTARAKVEVEGIAAARKLTLEEFRVWGEEHGLDVDQVLAMWDALRASANQALVVPRETYGHGISYIVQESLSTMQGKTSWCIFTATNQFTPVAIFETKELAVKVCDLLNKEQR